MVADPHRSARVAAVLGELLELGDLALAFDPGRVAGGSGSISRWIRLRTWRAKWGVEGPARARMSSAVSSVPLAPEQGRVLGLAHGSFPPILASSARLSISACCPTPIAPSSPITQTWL